MSQTATPSVPTLLAGEDTGRSDSDGNTDIKMPTLVGQAVAGATVTIRDTDDSVLGTGIANTSGYYSIVLSQALNEGGHLITATAIAPGDSQSLHSGSLPLTEDSMAPDAPAAPILMAADDTGFSAEDGITSQKILHFTGLAEPNALVQLYNIDSSDPANVLTSAVLASAIAASDGSYTLTTATLPDGSYKFAVTATDVAGNVAPIGKDTAFSSVTIDSVAPAMPSAPSLDVGSDTGVLRSDGLTDINMPVVTGTTQANATVELFDAGVMIGKGMANDSGAYAITATTLADGAHALTVKAVDAAGNTSAASAALNIVVDTAAPTASSTPDANDAIFGSVPFELQFSEPVTGLSLSALKVIGTGTATGEVIQITGSGSDYTVLVDGLSGAGSLRLALATGNQVTDEAGNAAQLTSSNEYVYSDQNTPFSVQIGTYSAHGTSGQIGLSSGGRLVSFDTDVSETANDTNPNPDVYVKDVRTGGITLISAGVDGSVHNGISGYSSLSANGTVIAFVSTATGLVPDGPTDGLPNVYVAQLSATNVPDGQAVSITNIQLVSAGNGQDGIFTPSDTETFYSIGNSGAPVVSADGTHVVFASDKALLPGVTPGISNIYEFDIATGELTLITDGPDNSGGNAPSYNATVSGDGTMITYTSNATNLGGPLNPAPGLTGAVGQNVYLYNVTTNTTTLLNAAGLLNLNPLSSDVESYGAQINSLGTWVTYTIQVGNDTAFIVNQNVAGADPNAGKLEQITPSTAFSFDIDSTVSMGGRYVAYGLNILGNTATPPDQVGLTDALTNIAIDIGTGSEPFLSSDGNTVAYSNENYTVSDGVTTDLGGQIVLTTLGPTVGIDQVGGDNELGATAWKQALKSGLVITGVTDASAGASVRLQLLDSAGAVLSTGQTTLTVDGVWSVTLAAADLAALADGTYRLNAVASAADGASFPSNRSITIDTQAPATPATPVLDAGSDTSTAGDGTATNLGMPTLTGSAEAGATITLYDNSGESPTLIGTAVADANGAYAITPTDALKDGKHSLDVTATDEAGNVSAASPDVTFTVDTVAPAQPTLVLAPASDTGASNSDGITKNASPTVTGIGEAGTTITLYDSDGLAVLGTTKVKGDGTWSLDSSNLSDGVHSLTVTATDSAGNVGPLSAPLHVTIDTTPPFAPTISSVNGVLVDGALAPLVTVSGTAAPNTTVTLRFDGGNDVLGTTTAAADGDYSLESDPLPAGAHMLSVVSTDLAGNDSQQSLQTAVTITNSAMPPPGTPPNSPTLVAQLTDGPIAGATVFADANGNGIQDASEASATTNTDGLVTLYNASGELIATGGIDTVTGLTPIGALTAPAGATAITPLTTLLDAYAAAVGNTPQAAQAGLLTALGLAATADLTQLNPEAVAAGGDLSFLIASASLMDTAVNFADLIAAQTAASPSTAFAAVFTALADQAASGTLNLASTLTMQTVLANAAALAAPGTVLPPTILAAGAAIAQTGNYDVGTAATPRNGITSEGFVDAIERVEQGEAAPQYAAAAGDPNSNVEGLYTYDLGAQVAIAEAPVLAAPVLSPGADTGVSSQDNITVLTNPVFMGIAPPGATVILVSGSFYAGGAVTIVGSGVADSTGRYAIAASLGQGANTIIAMQATPNEPIANGTAVAIPAMLLATQMSSVVVGVLPEETDIPVIEQASYVADSAETATQTSLYVSGKGAFFVEGASFTITADDNAVPIGTAQVETGAFGIVTTPLSNGIHSLVVTETALDGETLQSLPFTVTVTAPGILAFDAEAAGPVAGGFIVPFDEGTALPRYDEVVHPAGATDAAGLATIPDVVGVPDQSGDSSYPVNQADSGIELVGGQDRLTGLPLPLDLGAPVAASVIDPATTLLNQAENHAESIFYPLTPAGAAFENARIDTALGLNTNINLVTADPLAMAEAGDPTLLLKNIELLDTAALLSPFGDLPFALIDNAEGTATFSSFVNGVPPAIVAPPIDFTNAASILGWLTTFYASDNPALLTAYDASVLPVAAQIIAASNAAIEVHAKSASSLADTLSYALAVERVAIGEEAPAFLFAAQQIVGSSPSDQTVTVQDAQFAVLQTAYTGARLTSAIAAALAQIVEVTNLAAQAATTDAASVTFDLSFSAPVTGLTTGDFAVSATAGLQGAAVTSVTPVIGGDGKEFSVIVGTGVGQGTLTLAFTPTGIAGAAGLFATAQTYASPVRDAALSNDDRVNGLAVGDFNGDGKPDIVATLEDSLTLFSGLGDGSFVAAPSIDPGGVNEASQIVTGDFNGDGKLDVAVLTDAATDLFGANPDYAVSVLLGTGNGSFQSPILTDVGPDVVAIATSDFNGDGKPDIAVLSQPAEGNGDGVVQLYDGKGDGTFTAGPSFDAGGASGVRSSVAGIVTAPQSLVAADLTGDGKADLVVSTITQTASGPQYSINVFINGGSGSFTAAPQIPLGSAESSDLSSLNPGGVLIAVADVNGDGIPDIIAVPAHQPSIYDQAAATPAFSVLLGKGDGTFQPAINVTLPPLPLYNGNDNVSIAVGDVTGDGVADLVIQNSAYGEIVVPGNGNGTFGAAYTTGSVSEESGNTGILTGLILADANGDGQLDLITSSNAGSAAGNSVGPGIAVALNTAQTVLPASAAVTISRPAVAQPAFTVASGAGTLTNIGNAYTLNLGTLAQGATSSVVLGLTNNAAAPADSFNGQFSLPSGSGFTISGASLPAAVAAGGSYTGLTFSVSTSTVGSHTETITFAPRDQSATVTNYTNLPGSDEVQPTTTFVDGADVAGELAPLTLVVTDNIAAVACFASGTRILTARGEIAVEALVVGDEVPVQSGKQSLIRWIGHRHVDCRRHSKPQDNWPVRIRPDAFGPAMPHHELWLSPDHAVFSDGVLIPIKFLINGTTITQDSRDDVTYWHVELAQHDVLSAEGLPCESYLDTGTRPSFTNGNVLGPAKADFFSVTYRAALWEATACAPLRFDGPAVERTVARLARRASALGFTKKIRKRRSSRTPHVKMTSDLAELVQSSWYLSINQDVAIANVDPTTHYINNGRAEGRLLCPQVDLFRSLGLIDPDILIVTMPDVIAAGVDPVVHFSAIGWIERRQPNAYFDTGWYLDRHDVPAGMNPLLHYLLSGENDGLSPSPHFDPAWYRKRYNIKPTASPLAHYLMHRRTQLFSPLPSFDVAKYRRSHALTMLPRRDPYAHFLAVGNVTSVDEENNATLAA